MPWVLALTAGVLAAVNPCGFALLPAYVSLLVTGDGVPRIRRAIALTAAMTAGFVTVFGAFGLLAAPAADWLSQRLPWVTIAIGFVLAGLGIWLLLGRELPSPVPKLGQAPVLDSRPWSMYLFGLSFAIASLGCTIGPFLGVVVVGFSTGSVVEGIVLFLAYAGGMALVVGMVALAVALAQHSVVRWMRRAAGVLTRVAGALMLLAGLYAAWYGWYEVRVFRDGTATDPIIEAAGELQTRLATFVENLGIALLAGLLTLIGLAAWWFTRRGAPR